MSALVAEVSQDWFKAHALLTRLHYLQGESVTAETYRHEIRVLRCLGSTVQALNLAKAALIDLVCLRVELLERFARNGS